MLNRVVTHYPLTPSTAQMNRNSANTITAQISQYSTVYHSHVSSGMLLHSATLAALNSIIPKGRLAPCGGCW